MNRLFWVGLVIAAAMLVVSSVTEKETSAVVDVLIEVEPLGEGHRLINGPDVLNLIELAFGYPLAGQMLGAVDMQRLEKVLEREPFVLDADAFVDARNQINIRIRQREPVLRIIDNNGLNYYLDKDGFQMPLSKHYSARVLVATGNIPPYLENFRTKKKYLLKDLFALAQRIREDEFLYPLVEQVYVNNRGEFTLVPKVGKQKILFGRYSEVESKIRRLKVFYQEALPYEGWQKYRTIDLNFDGQVVAR